MGNCDGGDSVSTSSGWTATGTGTAWTDLSTWEGCGARPRCITISERFCIFSIAADAGSPPLSLCSDVNRLGVATMAAVELRNVILCRRDHSLETPASASRLFTGALCETTAGLELAAIMW